MNENCDSRVLSATLDQVRVQTPPHASSSVVFTVHRSGVHLFISRVRCARSCVGCAMLTTLCMMPCGVIALAFAVMARVYKADSTPRTSLNTAHDYSYSTVIYCIFNALCKRFFSLQSLSLPTRIKRLTLTFGQSGYTVYVANLSPNFK